MSEELVSRAVQRAKQRPALEVGDVPDWTIQVTPDMIEEVPTSKEHQNRGFANPSANANATTQCCDDPIDEVSVDEPPKAADNRATDTSTSRSISSTNGGIDEPEDQLVMLSDKIVEQAAARAANDRTSTFVEWTSTSIRSLALAIVFGLMIGSMILLVAYVLL